MSTFDHSYDRTSDPAPFILGSTIHNHQLSSTYTPFFCTSSTASQVLLCVGGFFRIASTGNSGNGTNSNVFSYVDAEGNTYDREVTAVNNVITSDHQGGTLAPQTAAPLEPASESKQSPLVITKPRLPGARKIVN